MPHSCFSVKVPVLIQIPFRSVFESTLYGEERSLVLADTLLQIYKVGKYSLKLVDCYQFPHFQTDLLVWRTTEEKSFPPLLLLAFGGSKDFVPNCCQLVKMLYRARLRGSLAEEKMVLTLVGLLAIVLEDIEEDRKVMSPTYLHRTWMKEGKEKLAAAIASELKKFAGQGRSVAVAGRSDKLRFELSLLRPCWLSAMVASNLLNIASTIAPLKIASQVEGKDGPAVDVVLQHAVGRHLREDLAGIDLLFASLSVHSSSTVKSLTLPIAI